MESFVEMAAIVLVFLIGKRYGKRIKRHKAAYRRSYNAWKRSRPTKYS